MIVSLTFQVIVRLLLRLGLSRVKPIPASYYLLTIRVPGQTCALRANSVGGLLLEDLKGDS
jgi:hypothetical protein